jgi:tetratricopeptide (TPR) repeat protein
MAAIPILRRIACVAVVAVGCASIHVVSVPELSTTLEQRLGAIGVEPADLVEPAAITAEMADWVRQRVPGSGDQSSMVRALLEAIVTQDGLGLQYDNAFTGTAQEVFSTRQANCLAFTHLVVGLGRELGLPVYYLGFRQKPRYERDGSLVVVWEHVTAGFGPAKNRLVLQLAVGPDFEFEDSRELSDDTSLAMHYSNRGAELLREDKPYDARQMLEIATAVDPMWPDGWVNLGVSLRRTGDLIGAEQAYRRALGTDPGHMQAYQNLAALLWLREERNAASEMLRLLDRHDNRNPYVFLSLGDMSLRVQRLDEARRYYRRAVRLAPGSAEPYAALGQLAFSMGDVKRARRYLEKAEARDQDDDRARDLSEMLTRSSVAGRVGS